MAYFNHIDDEFDFGKFKGLSLSDVMDISPQYIVWCMFNVINLPFVISDEAMKELSMIYPSFIVDDTFEQQRQRLIKKWEYREVKEDRRHGYYYGNAETEMYEYRDTYERYGGSYVQDCMEYSDEEIDTIFDGEPLAYWNID